jgi:hypothetical protein
MGLLVLGFGALCFWLAWSRPGEKNAWVPWIVGTLFSSLGLFSTLGRSKVVFDGGDRTWTDSWGFLFLNFRKRGSFDKLDRVVVEESVSNGFTRYYIWVKGGRGIRLLTEIASTRDEAERISAELSGLIGIPVRGRRSGP